MSSSPTELAGRRHDAPDGRLGRRGHGRRVEEAARRLGGGRRDDRLDLHRQDRHRRRVAGHRPRAGDPRRGRRDRRGGRRDRAHRHRRRSRARRTSSENAPRPRANGARERRPPPAPAATPRPRPRRYSPVVQRIAAEHGIDLDSVEGTGRDGRVRKQDVLAASRPGGGAADAHREPVPARRAVEAQDAEPRFGPRRRPPAAPASAAGARALSRMRQPIGEHMVRLAAHRGARARRSSRPT